MPANKNALIRYKTIDNCLRNIYRKWTLDDLVDACSDALYDCEGITKGVSVRTVQGDIQMMRSDKLGYNAPIEVYDHKYYRYSDPDYSIMNMPMSQNDYEVMQEAVDMLRQLDGFEQFSEISDVVSRIQEKLAISKGHTKPVINFDSVPNLKGLRFLNPLYNHITHKQTLKIMYKPFSAEKPVVLIIYPYLLKEFRNRWFLFGCRSRDMILFNLPLDRIMRIEPIDIPFRENPCFDSEHFFDDVIGVSKNIKDKPHIVKFWANEEQSKYILTKPVHISQKLITRNPRDNSCIFSINVVINYEMYSVFMSYGAGVKIIYPNEVFQTMKKLTAEMAEMYETPGVPKNNQYNIKTMMTIEKHNVKIFTDNIDENALKQISELLSIDVFSDKKIRIMPDVHADAGCVIGFTGDLGDKVIPNIVGVDIGCGMHLIKFKEKESINYHEFNEYINATIPSGTRIREEKRGFKPLKGQSVDIYREAKSLVTELYCYRDLKNTGRINMSIGTLGGGNHFIELDKDDEGWTYLVIHTGSRNLGKQVADIYQEKAIKHLTEGADDLEDNIKRIIEEYKATGRRSEIETTIRKIRKEFKYTEPSLPSGLCYLEGQGREDYLHDMRLCQHWAVLNRKLIAIELMKFFGDVDIVDEFECIHNYISEDNIIRKGAISAKEGERCIIPLNMRDGSLICTGKGNPDWNYSAPHGAGRILSRTQAYNQISMADFTASMTGIYSETINDYTRDESPMAYKPADEIIANITPTVTIDEIIRPIFNFKASN